MQAFKAEFALSFFHKISCWLSRNVFLKYLESEACPGGRVLFKVRWALHFMFVLAWIWDAIISSYKFDQLQISKSFLIRHCTISASGTGNHEGIFEWISIAAMSSLSVAVSLKALKCLPCLWLLLGNMDSFLPQSLLATLFPRYLCDYIIHAYKPSCKIKIEWVNGFWRINIKIRPNSSQTSDLAYFTYFATFFCMVNSINQSTSILKPCSSEIKLSAQDSELKL